MSSSGGKKSSPQFRWRRRKRRSKAQYPEMSRYLLPIDDGEEVQHLGRTLECTLCGLRGKRCHLTLHFKAKHNEVIDLSRAKNLAAGISSSNSGSSNNNKKSTNTSAKQQHYVVNNNNNNNGNSVKVSNFSTAPTCDASTKVSAPSLIMSKPIIDVSSSTSSMYHRSSHDHDSFFLNNTPISLSDDQHNLSADNKDHFRANFDTISASGECNSTAALVDHDSLGVVSSFGSSPRAFLMPDYGASPLEHLESPHSFSSSEEMSTMSPRYHFNFILVSLNLSRNPFIIPGR